MKHTIDYEIVTNFCVNEVLAEDSRKSLILHGTVSNLCYIVLENNRIVLNTASHQDAVDCYNKID
jgi:hypothetical protein